MTDKPRKGNAGKYTAKNMGVPMAPSEKDPGAAKPKTSTHAVKYGNDAFRYARDRIQIKRDTNIYSDDNTIDKKYEDQIASDQFSDKTPPLDVRPVTINRKLKESKDNGPKTHILYNGQGRTQGPYTETEAQKRLLELDPKGDGDWSINLTPIGKMRNTINKVHARRLKESNVVQFPTPKSLTTAARLRNHFNILSTTGNEHSDKYDVSPYWGDGFSRPGQKTDNFSIHTPFHKLPHEDFTNHVASLITDMGGSDIVKRLHSDRPHSLTTDLPDTGRREKNSIIDFMDTNGKKAIATIRTMTIPGVTQAHTLHVVRND